MANKALDFDGTDDRVQVSSSATLDIGTGDLTIEAWVKTGLSSRGEVVERGNNVDNKGYVLYINATGEIDFGKVDGARLTSAGTVNDSAWHYIVGVRDGDYFRIYIDGVVDDNSLSGQSALNFQDAGYALFIGIRSDLTTDYLGIIDEVRISDVARTAGEISANWNSGNGKRLEVDGNTLSLWHMNEGANSTAYDETANDNDGTIIGASWVDGFPFPTGRSFGYIIG
ncbi:hypothetical protein LCGC14_1714730 [marine sediment metagenome]|uniref:LamG-like jellyroll fold domain-containing protein n=1 Tax=marine sediment metagenome TaxID=412755 RepID=A0A0F9JUQ9_9ZZZZ